jgi:hypothetical protein
MRIICTGGRNYTDYFTVYYALKDLPNETEIIHGDADGTDAIVDAVARGFGYKVYPVPADWDYYGRQAGPMRNRQMVDQFQPVDIVYAFPGDDGTEDMVLVAFQNNIPVKRFGLV